MTATLEQVLTDESRKNTVIDDCCELIDAEVKDKGGLSGLAIKAGYGAVKGIKPGFIREAVTSPAGTTIAAMHCHGPSYRFPGAADVDVVTAHVADAARKLGEMLV